MPQRDQFDSWMKDHLRILHRIANGFAQGTDRADLLQELMLAVWRALPAFQGDARPSTFIYRVAFNRALTWSRTERNYRRRLDDFEREAESVNSPGTGNDLERLERLYAAIHRLPPLDRTLVLLSLEGVSHRDMGEIHGLSENNVGVRLNRARQRLTQILNPNAS